MAVLFPAFEICLNAVDKSLIRRIIHLFGLKPGTLVVLWCFWNCQGVVPQKKIQSKSG